MGSRNQTQASGWVPGATGLKRTEITDGLEPPCVCWASNPGLLQDHQVLWTTKFYLFCTPLRSLKLAILARIADRWILEYLSPSLTQIIGTPPCSAFTWVLGSKFSPHAYTAGTFTHWATYPTPEPTLSNIPLLYARFQVAHLLASA